MEELLLLLLMPLFLLLSTQLMLQVSQHCNNEASYPVLPPNLCSSKVDFLSPS
jgi:hypothetical protein